MIVAGGSLVSSDYVATDLKQQLIVGIIEDIDSTLKLTTDERSSFKVVFNDEATRDKIFAEKWLLEGKKI